MHSGEGKKKVADVLLLVLLLTFIGKGDFLEGIWSLLVMRNLAISLGGEKKKSPKLQPLQMFM